MNQQISLPGFDMPATQDARAAHPQVAASDTAKTAAPHTDGPESMNGRQSPAAASQQAGDAASAPEMEAPGQSDNTSNTWPPISEMLQSLFVFEPTTATLAPITVMGMDCASPHHMNALHEDARERIRHADIICAGDSLLKEIVAQPLPHAQVAAKEDGEPLAAELLPLHAPLAPLLTRLSHLRAAGKRVLVLADGDPLLFGIGATLVRQLGAEAVRILPAVSSLQQACARLALPWHRVICISLHGRDDLHPLHTACSKNVPLCILTDERMTPDVLARHLLDRGVDWFAAHIFERMGASDEDARHMSLTDAAGCTFGPACTMVLLPTEPVRRPYLGLEADQLAVEGGCMTKKPVRAAALAMLRIAPQHIVWDIGAGSGAMALEASVLAHEGRVIAVERSAGRAIGIQENRRRFGAASVDVRLGQAPDCLPGLPDPDRVFIGGGLSGGDGADILGYVCHRLPVGGRVVASCVLLDSLHLCRRFFEKAGWPHDIMQMSAAEGRELGDDIHLAAMNPVFLVAAQKPAAVPTPGRMRT